MASPGAISKLGTIIRGNAPPCRTPVSNGQRLPVNKTFQPHLHDPIHGLPLPESSGPTIPTIRMLPPSTRLRRAIHTSDVLLVRRILKSHPHLLHNPDTSSTGQSNTSLHLAASLGHLAVVKLLLSLGHESDGPSLNELHQTPLHLAASAGHTEVVHHLAQTFPHYIPRRDIHGRDAIMLAALAGHDTVLQILLTYHPDGASEAVQAADLDGNTALHFASSNGNLLVLRTLLAAGADAGRRNVWSWTAVSYSATVQAEVYLKGLVAEQERRRKVRGESEERLEMRKGTGKGGAGAMGVRIVNEEVDV